MFTRKWFLISGSLEDQGKESPEYFSVNNRKILSLLNDVISAEFGLMENNISDYYRLWSRQLLKEFSHICFQYKLLLDPPVIAITESNTRFGSWSPATREIKISGRLIRNYHWDVTLQVFKHEIAHQICSEIFYDSTGGHGANFIKACNILGLPERFCHATGDLPEKIRTQEREENDLELSRNIIEKIRKLFALAESSNEHESALAMEKAGKLLKRYNLEQYKVDVKNRYVYAIINTQKKRIEEYQHRIISVLVRYFYVKALCAAMYDPFHDESYKTFEIFGRKENVEIAEYCYHFLEKKLAALWRQNSGNFHRNARTEKRSYYLGLLHGFSETLRKKDDSGDIPKSSGPALTSSELIVAGDIYLDRFIHIRYPRLAKRSRGCGKVYHETFADGVKDGRIIVIHKGVTEKQSNNMMLIS